MVRLNDGIICSYFFNLNSYLRLNNFLDFSKFCTQNPFILLGNKIDANAKHFNLNFSQF